MGLSSSSNEFCRRSDAVFAGIPGIRKLVDDILVKGNDLQDLENKICMVLQCSVDHGFILSTKKYEIGSSVHFACYIRGYILGYINKAGVFKLFSDWAKTEVLVLLMGH